jgi:anti-sigma regulatory factor (Ser/Thr protein kinase)
LYDRYIEIQVWDYGPEFDLQQISTSHHFDPEAAGGRGIRLIARLADHFEYISVL